ncbi:DUF2768 family protein [Cohnella faecalis]|nr:DUF2768 family protein [Cohnella faecalis]
MEKMWVSFLGIGLMVIAAVIISFARLKTRGWVKLVLSSIAFVMLLFGFVYGMFAII